MRKLLALAAVGIVLLAAQSASATIRPGRGMSGVWLGMTKAQVQAKLGRPIGTGGGRFYYARVWVGFRVGRVAEITTTRSTERTVSGVGVGSPESAVRRAYPGVACAPAAGFRRCRLGTGKPGTRATDFLIGHGLVLQITVQLLPV
jgi:hypothetical protein